MPLFADQVASEQGTPQARIERFDQELLAFDQGHRDLAAKHWRWGRRQVECVCEETREEILARWNESWIPPHAAYFADFVRTELKRRGLAVFDDA